jgi:putative flippase GtrA
MTDDLTDDLAEDRRGRTLTMNGSTALRGGLARMVREVAKFGVVGVAGIFVNLGVFNLLRHGTQLQVVRAGVIATVVAIAFNYVGFRYFTYRERDKNGRTRELGLFLAFSAVGLVIENGVLYAATYGFGWDSQLQSNIFKFVGIGMATLFRFWSYRSWVFRTLPVPAFGDAVAASPDTAAGAQPFLAEPPVGPARQVQRRPRTPVR